MLHVLREIEARHFTWHLLLLVVLVFVATPLLKHTLFKRGREGSIYQPPRQQEWTQSQKQQARRYLAEQRRKQATGDVQEKGDDE
jgi:hypothetical protein